MRSETEPVEEAEDEWAGSEAVGCDDRSVETVMRVRVPKKRRVEEFAKDLEVGRGCASLGGSGLSERLEVRTEAILRMLGREENKTRKGRE